ncbi:MAG TPA: dihydrolipoyl dehydrogenase [Candidatus Nanopelagicales bacterium]|nr:dihydrolipoyl dehydrogenase [Candidatus Nanopelagicales bacterium]
MPTFDLVVLGGGSGGYAAALRGAQLGLSVALIEKDKLGGTCLHYGCIPTKALLHAAEVADAAKDAGAFGIQATFQGVDLPGVYGYRDGVVGRLYKGLQGLVKSRSVELVEGTGRLTSPTTVAVGDQTYTASKAVILATGSYARSLPGLEIGGRVITSCEALSLDFVPSSAIVLGGGVIGVEFASVWRSFGSEVTIVEALPRLVPNEDEACSKALDRAFRKRGIKAKTGVRFQGVTQDANGVTVTLEGGETLQADVLLVAVGRGPNATGMGFEEVGVAMDRGFVLTDERLRTNVPGVFAVGDIVPGLQLAHRGFQQGIFVAEEVAGLNPRVIDEAGIPRVTYCDPEVASVGLTEAQAKEKYGDGAIESLEEGVQSLGGDVETYEYNLGGNGKSQILGTTGFVKLVRVKDGPVVGVHMVGARVGELIGEGQLVVNWEAYPEDVASLVHAHPTQNEAFGEAFLALAGKPLHAHS